MWLEMEIGSGASLEWKLTTGNGKNLRDAPCPRRGNPEKWRNT
jgi:hypothetical protein